MAMQHTFTVGEPVITNVHGQGPKTGHVVRITAQRITVKADNDASITQFRVSDHGLVGWGGMRHVIPFNQTVIDDFQQKQELNHTRFTIFGHAGSLLSPERWSDDPATMRQIADAYALFLRQVEALGVELDKTLHDWLTAQKVDQVL